LDNGADIDGRNASGNTALQFACIKGDIRLASLLIDRGADVFAQSSDKGTAIDYAEGASMFLGVAFNFHFCNFLKKAEIIVPEVRRSDCHC
jgi:ankyrin repeat protein